MISIEKSVSKKIALVIFCAGSCVAITYHLLVLTGIIGYENAWGGRLPNLHAMYVFEIMSVITQLLFIVLACAKYFNIGGRSLQKALSIVFYGIFIMLLLNTFGNVLAISLFEKIIFTPITFIMSIAAFRIAKNE